MAFELAAFNPISTTDSVFISRTYFYSPSVVNGRIWATVGLGTDTLCSLRLGQPTVMRPLKPSKPFWRPDKLVADPGVVKTPKGYRVFHTIGEILPNGLGNGVGYYDADGNGNPIAKTSKVLIPQNGSGTYGTGQPSVCRTSIGVWMMFVREDGPNGENTIGAYSLQVSTQGDMSVLDKYSFSHGLEDGASPDLFWWKGRLHMLVTGGGPVGFRSYLINWGTKTLVRETHKESNVGGFYAQGTYLIPERGDWKVRDGACIERNLHNEPVVSSLRGVNIWYGYGTDYPGTWQLRRSSLFLP